MVSTLFNGITGQPGELIDRLIEALDRSPTEQPDVFEQVASTVAHAIGGQLLENVVIEGRQPPRGSLSAELRRDGRTASRDEYLALIRARPRTLVADGMLEEFLVSALRNEVDRYVAVKVDVAARTDRRRRRRNRSIRIAGDPQELVRFRALLKALGDPSIDLTTDDELAEKLREFANAESADPDSPTEALDGQRVQSAWEPAREDLLSDRDIETWMLLSVAPYVLGNADP